MSFTDEQMWASYERVLRNLGWERTRENMIRVMYNDPPDLRMRPAPDVPFPDEEDVADQGGSR